MYGNPAMTCFKYQVYLYGSEAITIWMLYFKWLQSQHYESSDFPPPPTSGSPPPSVWLHNLHPFGREL